MATSSWQEELEAERKQERVFMRRTIPAIARYMAGDWTAKLDFGSTHMDTRAELYHKDQRTLVVHHDIKKNRLFISGIFPCRFSGSAFYFDDYTKKRAGVQGNLEISVNAKKEPNKIAQDIRNRLLPDYIKALAYAQEQISIESAQIQKRLALQKAIAEAFGEDFQDNRPHSSYFGNLYSRKIQAEVTGSSVTVTIQLGGSQEWMIRQLKDLITVVEKKPKKLTPRRKTSCP